MVYEGASMLFFNAGGPFTSDNPAFHCMHPGWDFRRRIFGMKRLKAGKRPADLCETIR